MRKYFIHDGQARKGPFNFEELKDISLKKNTLVWYHGLKGWEKAENIDELDDIFIGQKTGYLPPPLPKIIEIDIGLRQKILNSFNESETVSVPKRRNNSTSFLLIISIIIIAGIIMTIFFFVSK